MVDRRNYIHGISHNDPTPTTALARHENDIMSELEIVGFVVRITVNLCVLPDLPVPSCHRAAWAGKGYFADCGMRKVVKGNLRKI